MSPYCSDPVHARFGAELVKKKCRRRFDRFAHVDHGAQGLVIDLNQLQRVFRRASVAGRHGAEGLADVADFFDRAGILVNGPLETGGVAPGLEWLGESLDVFRSDHRHHVGVFERLGRVDRVNFCVSMGATQYHRLEHARQYEIIRIKTAAGNVTRAFLAAGTTTNNFSHSSFLWPRP
jgi:hypothetical protein